MNLRIFPLSVLKTVFIFAVFLCRLCLPVFVSITLFPPLRHTRHFKSAALTSTALKVEPKKSAHFGPPTSISSTLSTSDTFLACFGSQERSGFWSAASRVLGRYCDQCLTSCLSTWEAVEAQRLLHPPQPRNRDQRPQLVWLVRPHLSPGI